jgi:hypothetical protein
MYDKLIFIDSVYILLLILDVKDINSKVTSLQEIKSNTSWYTKDNKLPNSEDLDWKYRRLQRNITEESLLS